MGEPKHNPNEGREELKVPRPYTDPMNSHRSGLGGLFETVLRRFKNFVHFVVMIPLYIVGCAIIGTAAAPGVAVAEWIMNLASSQPTLLRYSINGFAFACGYFTYGFTMLFMIPLVNLILHTKPHAWRGPYYSLEVIRWYIHNGMTYLVRYTFLELVTPTPFNLLFYKMMGMKIGKGTAINSTCISDPAMIELGDQVTIGGSATIIAHYAQGGFLVLAPVKIGNRATIGLRATIMGGVEIGESAKIMPNSMVLPRTKVPAGETWGGVPAQKIK